MNTYSTQQIAEQVNGDLIGRHDLVISNIEDLDAAKPGQICFVRDAHFAAKWPESKADAVLTDRNFELDPGQDRAVIMVPNVDQALICLLEMFQPPIHKPEAGIHPAATVDPTAQVDPTARIGPGCVIGPHARVGASSTLHAMVFIGAQAVVGDHNELFAGVVIGDRCELGHHVTIYPNTVIGADGFGYVPAPEAPDGTGLRKVPQIGIVRIGNHVEIGANTCIDRGKFSATTIGDGSKIDNLCQIAHNCRLGRSCIIAGQTGLGGSATIHDAAMFGGRAGVHDHVTIGAGAKIGATSVVTQDMPAGATWVGSPAHDLKAFLREAVAIRKLPNLLKEVRALSKRVK